MRSAGTTRQRGTSGSTDRPTSSAGPWRSPTTSARIRTGSCGWRRTTASPRWIRARPRRRVTGRGTIPRPVKSGSSRRCPRGTARSGSPPARASSPWIAARARLRDTSGSRRAPERSSASRGTRRSRSRTARECCGRACSRAAISPGSIRRAAPSPSMRSGAQDRRRMVRPASCPSRRIRTVHCGSAATNWAW